jgi:hypothetical protein
LKKKCREKEREREREREDARESPKQLKNKKCPKRVESVGDNKTEKDPQHTHTHKQKTEIYSCMMNQDNILQGVYTYYRASFPIYQKKLSHKNQSSKGEERKYLSS